MSALYPYASGDLLVDRNTYSYSPFHGDAFLGAWKAERDGVLRLLPAPAPAPAAVPAAAPDHAGFATADLLEFLAGRIVAGSCPVPSDASPWLDLLVQRFEVTKRLHRAYTAQHRAVDRAEFRDLALYVRFAEVLALAHGASGSLSYLSTLLKCMDTLCASRAEMDAELAGPVARLIDVERAAVRVVAERSASRGDWRDAEPATPNREHGVGLDGGGASAVPILLAGVILLAAHIARSRAYVDALVRAGLRPERVLLYGRPQPELSQSLRETCESAGLPTDEIATGHVNDAAVVEHLRALDPRLVIYSGYGGQIVSPEALSAAGGFLHLHAGWLPGERGSTTIYYGLLREGRCAVSALLLAPDIDAGPIVTRRRYPAPPAGTDVDRVYDSAIRADLLVRALRHYALDGGFAEALPQETEAGTMHYIIHPVLKHIALLRLPLFTPSSRSES